MSVEYSTPAFFFWLHKTGIPNPRCVDRYGSINILLAAHSGTQWKNALFIIIYYLIYLFALVIQSENNVIDAAILRKSKKNNFILKIENLSKF